MEQEDLKKQIQILTDTEAIKQLTYRYAEICDDSHNPDRICSVFTADAVWDGGEQFGKFCGHSEIQAGFAGFSKTISISQHQMANAIISVDGNKATGEWAAVSILGKEDGNFILAVRYYKNYEKVNGRWLIKHLRPVCSIEERI